ncbi:hypothetical protein, partial [Vibrio parahaemolyticus]|uniref:hypothetical protein n=1 Tax=Vibrio parahaemolyticus TaxID=670 RepID=UPI001C5EB414
FHVLSGGTICGVFALISPFTVSNLTLFLWRFFSFVVFTKSELPFFGIAVEVRGSNPFLI